MAKFQTESGWNSSRSQLSELIEHSYFVSADLNLGEVYQKFSYHDYEMMAICANSKVVGVCTRQEVAMRLGSQFGRAIFAKNNILDFKRESFLSVTFGQSLTNVLSATFSRDNRYFYDDVVLVDDEENFVGIITSFSLVRLQNKILDQNIVHLQQQQEEIHQQNKMMNRDLLIAQQFQMALLDQKNSGYSIQSEDPHLTFSHIYKPATGVSGDFFHFYRTRENQTGILLCDVMGHGVRSALITGILLSLANQYRQYADNPVAMLTQLNQDLCAIFEQTPETIFVTAVYALIDPVKNLVITGTAGHHGPKLVNYNNKKVNTLGLDTATFPLGLFKESTYAAQNFKMDTGDALVVYTDGVTEAMNDEGLEYGERRLEAFLLKQKDVPFELIAEKLLKDVKNFSGKTECADDFCFIGTKLK